MKLNQLISVLLGAVALVSCGESNSLKQLVCERPVEEALKEYERQKSIMKFDKELLDAIVKQEERCIASNVTFGEQLTFVFDSAGLNSTVGSNVEVSAVINCVEPYMVSRAEMEVTPNVISFTFGGQAMAFVFDVDRKTLKAGYSKEVQDYTCVLQDFDTSEHKI